MCTAISSIGPSLYSWTGIAGYEPGSFIVGGSLSDVKDMFEFVSIFSTFWSIFLSLSGDLAG